jgi:Tol biopolymer transport system component
MKKNMYKYLLLFIVALLSCKDEAVVSTAITNGTNPAEHVVAYDTPGRGKIFLFNFTTKRHFDITLNVVDEYYYSYVQSFSENGSELLYTLDYMKPGSEDLYFCQRDDIFTYNLISGKTVRISDTEARERNPRFSKDGRHIIYDVSENGVQNVYTIDSDGKNKRLLIQNAYSPSYVLNDQKILYSSYRNGKAEYYLCDPNGGNEEQLTNNGLGGYNYYSSYDHNIFVFSVGQGIYKYDLDKRIPTLLIPHPNTNGFDINLLPKISGDSKYIVYLNTNDDRIYLYNLENKSKIDLGESFVTDFTRDSRNVVSLKKDGMHSYGIYSQKDSLILPRPTLSFGMVVGSLK